MEDKSVKQLLMEIAQQLQPIAELSLEVTTQAELQAYTENLYNQLVQLACEGMDFIGHIKVDQVITKEWAAKRDQLLLRGQRLVQDAPDASL